MCKFEIYPVVKEEGDERYNKESDYSIFRILNRVTYIVIEVKLSVGACLTAEDQDKLAQLFLEGIYLFTSEGKSRKNSLLLCVLTDGTTWHMIKTDMTCKPLKFSLYTCTTYQDQKWDSNISTICDQFVGHIKECHDHA